MVPELRQLRYFVAVAEELHFSRAAVRLNMAQPPLTQQIKLLERALGVQLFVRTTRHVELTPAGAAFLEGARRTLAEAGRSVELARRAARGEFDTLRVGFTDAAVMSILPRAIESFRQTFSGVYLDLHDDQSASQLIESVERDLVDVALMRGPLEETALRVDTIIEEPFWLALPEAHALATRARVSIKLLRDVPLILFPRRLSPAYYDQLITVCQAAGFTPDIAYEVEKYATILGLIAGGVGATLVPRSNRNLARAGVAYRPLTGTSMSAVVIAAYRSDRPSVPLEGFLAAARQAADT
jgi:DNA-binding transcriptional LysR family regulator